MCLVCKLVILFSHKQSQNTGNKWLREAILINTKPGQFVSKNDLFRENKLTKEGKNLVIDIKYV